MTHTLISAEELMAELATTYACEICQAGVGVVVEHEGEGHHEYGGDWHVVVLHRDDCPPVPKVRTLRLVDTDSHKRCRGCGGLLQVDLGGGLDGEVEAVTHCPRCDPRPTTHGGGAA